jgi:predicted hydrocarbon binding protein
MTASESASGVTAGYMPPMFPLQLLEAVRAHDRPGEILEDEDVSVSLPRRLGLTGVVDTQIRRYQVARPWRRSVSTAEIQNLVRLVLRRPDAHPILLETGRRLARAHFESAPTGALRILPRTARLLAARRAARGLIGSILGGAAVEVQKPLTVRTRATALATLDEDGSACAIVTGLLEELLTLWVGGGDAVAMTACASRGADSCEWSMVEAPATE